MADLAMQCGQEAVDAYWIPGCSSCLRMKEFLENSGVQYNAINLADTPERGEELKKHGLLAPAVVVGDQAVSGVDLKSVADLVGVDYDPPKILSPAELGKKYARVSAVFRRLLAQIPQDQLLTKLPDRDRTLGELAGHVGSIMRAFILAYQDDLYLQSREEPTEAVETKKEIAACQEKTESMFAEWWRSAGADDPLDHIIETYWGARTLHEVLERAVWHTAQHTRQVALFLEKLGIEPDRPLTAADLDGLPVPERVHG